MSSAVIDVAPLGAGGGGHFLDAVVGSVGDVEVAGAVERHAVGPSSKAEVAAPASPVWPEVPEELPATV